jgi:hypothetical protein
MSGLLTSPYSESHKASGPYIVILVECKIVATYLWTITAVSAFRGESCLSVVHYRDHTHTYIEDNLNQEAPDNKVVLLFNATELQVLDWPDNIAQFHHISKVGDHIWVNLSSD